MPTCKPCLSHELKDVIHNFTSDRQTIMQLNQIPDCSPGEIMNICECSGRGVKGEKKKREPSAYNIFIKECLGKYDLKGQPFGTAGKFMAGCAAEWRQSKGR